VGVARLDVKKTIHDGFSCTEPFQVLSSKLAVDDRDHLEKVNFLLITYCVKLSIFFWALNDYLFKGQDCFLHYNEVRFVELCESQRRFHQSLFVLNNNLWLRGTNHSKKLDSWSLLKSGFKEVPFLLFGRYSMRILELILKDLCITYPELLENVLLEYVLLNELLEQLLDASHIGKGSISHQFK